MTEHLIPSNLLQRVEAFAAIEGRSASEMLREAVERYLYLKEEAVEANSGSVRSPADAAARMLDRRKHHPLADGETIRDLLDHGRS